MTKFQVINDSCNSETLSIRELFLSPELQFTLTSGILGNIEMTEISTDSISDYTGLFSAYHRMWQASEVNNQNYRNKGVCNF